MLIDAHRMKVKLGAAIKMKSIARARFAKELANGHK